MHALPEGGGDFDRDALLGRSWITHRCNNAGRLRGQAQASSHAAEGLRVRQMYLVGIEAMRGVSCGGSQGGDQARSDLLRVPRSGLAIDGGAGQHRKTKWRRAEVPIMRSAGAVEEAHRSDRGDRVMIAAAAAPVWRHVARNRPRVCKACSRREEMHTLGAVREPFTCCVCRQIRLDGFIVRGRR